MVALHLFYVATLLVATLAPRIQATVLVQSSTTIAETVLGCPESFVCEGRGNAVSWSVNRLRGYTIPTEFITTVVDNVGMTVRSSLVLPNVTVEDGMTGNSPGRTYVCGINGGPASTALEATLMVRNTIVHIQPIEDIDITGRSVGETVSFECSVLTCQESIEVVILKDSQLLTRRNFPDGKDTSVQVSLTISEDTADLYRCLALLPDGRAFNETFSITGTPRATLSNVNSPPYFDPGRSQPVSQLSPTEPSSAKRGSASIISPQIHLLIILLAAFLVAVSAL